jgi:hypothetical protein
MFRTRYMSLALLAIAILIVSAAAQAPPTRVPEPPPVSKARPAPPRLVPIAETKLLMDGLTHANFQGLEKILKQKEIDADSWAFARGQALLIAETGNLLMLRPPKNMTGTDTWMRASIDLRDSASQLAKTVATRDRERSRAGLTSLANTCNKCHQTFSVNTRVTAFDEVSIPKP